MSASPRHAPALLALLLCGCSATQGRFQPFEAALPPKPADCAIEIFENRSPERAYVKVARVDAHREMTGFANPAKEELLPELRRQGCLAGGDALVDLRETRSSHLEARSYHLTATAVAWR